MTQEKQTIYRIDTAGPFDMAAFADYSKSTLGYATGDPDDIRRFYEATGKKVSVIELTVPHITTHDAAERVRLEDLIKTTSNPTTPTGLLHRVESQR